MSLQRSLSLILQKYGAARNGPFGGQSAVWDAFEDAVETLYGFEPVQRFPKLDVSRSVGKGKWARVPHLTILDTRVTTTPKRGIFCAFLFREDMSGVYLALSQGVDTEQSNGTTRRDWLRRNNQQIREAVGQLAGHFHLDDDIDLRATGGYAKRYQQAVAAYRFYPAEAIPPDEEIRQDLDRLLNAYQAMLATRLEAELTAAPSPAPVSFDRAAAIEELIVAIEGSGFVFEPWQIATYVTALRTKPLVILAGVSGTGKSKLPQLVARYTGGAFDLVAVRPNWTDSDDVIGFTNYKGEFRPGAVLQNARRANESPDRFFTCIVDEMNLARVEHYFAEILSFIESREPVPEGGFRSRALAGTAAPHDSAWADVHLSSNFGLVGTVNMDESSHPFSRKVLDRAFTIELSEIELTRWRTPVRHDVPQATWPVSAWWPRAIQPARAALSEAEAARVDAVVALVDEANRFLTEAQLQVAFRTRDEIAFFVLHAAEVAGSFRTSSGAAVDPIDIALHMKVLPRIIGSSNPLRRALLKLLGWTIEGRPYRDEQEAKQAVGRWERDGRAATLGEARFPRTAARLCLMWDRLTAEGHTSFWL